MEAILNTNIIWENFGAEMRELMKLAGKKNIELTWGVDESFKFTIPRVKFGATWELQGEANFIDMQISIEALLSPNLLYVTVAHELVHVRDVLDGSLFNWEFDHSSVEAEWITEYHAHLRSAALEQQFGMGPMISNPEFFRSLLPSTFDASIFKR